MTIRELREMARDSDHITGIILESYSANTGIGENKIERFDGKYRGLLAAFKRHRKAYTLTRAVIMEWVEECDAFGVHSIVEWGSV
jgi:hypothetical protein